LTLIDHKKRGADDQQGHQARGDVKTNFVHDG